MDALFRVGGIRCGHCVEILERVLGRIPGVRRVRVDPPAGRLAVDFDPYRVSEAVLEAAIRDAGFHPRSGAPLPPPPWSEPE